VLKLDLLVQFTDYNYVKIIIKIKIEIKYKISINGSWISVVGMDYGLNDQGIGV
jgi:hypothetical protein